MLLLLYIFSFFIFSSLYDQILANHSYSQIQGITKTSVSGEIYYSFRGMPYAKPPVGPLRFKDPQPLDDHPDIIDARYDGHDCPSIYATNASEDCLTINVYTRSLNLTAALPVLVMIHPGGLYIGSGLSSYLDAEYLMSKEIVVVTFNYRLGTLGFLSLGSKDVPGNAGFKDQVLALRWVQDYIVFFGGDKHNVTLMGYSAGALSVSLHLVSPMSHGLFHKAIMMSGVLPPNAEVKHAQLELAEKQAKVLHCEEIYLHWKFSSIRDPSELLDCFNGFTGNEIAATLRSMFLFGKDNPIYLWLPVVEPDFGQERFLTENVTESLKKGDFMNVPLLVGFTEGEFCESAINISNNATLSNALIQNFEVLAPKIFMYDGMPHNWQLNATKRLKMEFIENGHMDCVKLCDIFSDAIVRTGLLEFSEYFERVYSYIFTYTNPRVVQAGNNCGGRPRAQHMDDLKYIFKMPTGHQYPTKADESVTDVFIGFLYDFISDRLFVDHKIGYYNIDTEIKIHFIPNKPFFPRRNFWRHINETILQAPLK